jgi:hypothetical protein
MDKIQLHKALQRNAQINEVVENNIKLKNAVITKLVFIEQCLWWNACNE